jgi:TonB-dependent starch-binding outer membrane protein SusC
MRTQIHGWVTLLAAVTVSNSCGWRTSGDALDNREGQIITAEDVERTGARNAWEVLKRSGTAISLGEDTRGNPGRVRQRGNSSIYLNNAPLLVVDEVRMADLAYLREIPAEAIEKIHIVNGARGTARYGTGAGNGVIIVTTRHVKQP